MKGQAEARRRAVNCQQTLTLQLLNKEKEQIKEAAAEAQKYVVALVLKKSHLSAFVRDMAEVVEVVIALPLIKHLKKKRVLGKINF